MTAPARPDCDRAYRALLDHMQTCRDCDAQPLCRHGRTLWTAWKKARR